MFIVFILPLLFLFIYFFVINHCVVARYMRVYFDLFGNLFCNEEKRKVKKKSELRLCKPLFYAYEKIR
jgi:hypothetical protein